MKEIYQPGDGKVVWGKKMCGRVWMGSTRVATWATVIASTTKRNHGSQE